MKNFTLEELRTIEDIFREYAKECPEYKIYKSIEDKAITQIVEMMLEE